MYYLINCSTHGIVNEQTLTVNSTDEWLTLQLQPYMKYKCCVFAVNEIGMGYPACQTVVTKEAGMVITLTYNTSFV